VIGERLTAPQSQTDDKNYILYARKQLFCKALSGIHRYHVLWWLYSVCIQMFVCHSQ